MKIRYLGENRFSANIWKHLTNAKHMGITANFSKYENLWLFSLYFTFLLYSYFSYLSIIITHKKEDTPQNVPS